MNLRDLTEKQLIDCRAVSERERTKWMLQRGRSRMTEYEISLWNFAYGKGFNKGLKVLEQ